MGIALFVFAKITLGQHYSPSFDSYVPNTIVKKGVYAWMRHPIYSANILFLIGLFLATGHALIAINTIILAAYYVDAAIQEESKLSEIFPEYRDYQLNTHLLWPRLRKFHRR